MEIELNKAIQILKEEFNPIMIHLFDSEARNEIRKDSDIDIAFLTDND